MSETGNETDAADRFPRENVEFEAGCRVWVSCTEWYRPDEIGHTRDCRKGVEVVEDRPEAGEILVEFRDDRRVVDRRSARGTDLEVGEAVVIEYESVYSDNRIEKTGTIGKVLHSRGELGGSFEGLYVDLDDETRYYVNNSGTVKTKDPSRRIGHDAVVERVDSGEDDSDDDPEILEDGGVDEPIKKTIEYSTGSEPTHLLDLEKVDEGHRIGIDASRFDLGLPAEDLTDGDHTFIVGVVDETRGYDAARDIYVNTPSGARLHIYPKRGKVKRTDDGKRIKHEYGEVYDVSTLRNAGLTYEGPAGSDEDDEDDDSELAADGGVDEATDTEVREAIDDVETELVTDGGRELEADHGAGSDAEYVDKDTAERCIRALAADLEYDNLAAAELDTLDLLDAITPDDADEPEDDELEIATDGGRDEWEPEPATLRDGETPDEAHARRNAAALASLKDSEDPEIVTDGGFPDDDPRAEWCERCQRYRIECSHTHEVATDGGTTNMSGDSLIIMDGHNDRAEELAEDTSLTAGEANVAALKEDGLSHAEIAEELGLSKSTVDEYSLRIKRRFREARGTVDELGDLLEDIDRGDGVATDGGRSKSDTDRSEVNDT